MFQNLLAGYRKRKKIKNTKHTIQFINELIYNGKYDLSEDSERKKFIGEISGTSDKIQLIQIYIIVNRITKAQLHIRDEQILLLNDELESIKIKLSLSPKDLESSKVSAELNKAYLKLNKANIQMQQAYLESEETKMHINLLFRQQHITSGKNEFRRNPYSFRGLIYKLEKVVKRPSTSEELTEIKESVDKLNEANLHLKETQTQQKELNDELEDLNRLNNTFKDLTIEEIEQSILRDSKLVSDIEKLQNGSAINKNDLD